MCAPGTHYKAGWGPRASEWRAHQAQKVHQDWARAQRGKCKLELPSKKEPSGEKQETPLGAEERWEQSARNLQREQELLGTAELARSRAALAAELIHVAVVAPAHEELR